MALPGLKLKPSPLFPLPRTRSEQARPMVHQVSGHAGVKGTTAQDGSLSKMQAPRARGQGAEAACPAS